MTQPPANSDPKQQRARAKRMALVLGAIATAIYVAFILTGVLGR
jgi:hypothetical protein